MMEILQPDGWPRPSGYSNGIKTKGDLVFVAGQVGWNTEGRFEADDLVGQTRQALENVVAVLAKGGAGPEHIARMTWYVADIDTYRASAVQIGKVYRDVLGAHYPAMSLVEVSRLYEEGALVEIEATAVVPKKDS